MLENIGKPGFETISRPDSDVVRWLGEAVAKDYEPRIAEIGVGIGATTKAACEILQNRGEVHLFDYHSKVSALRDDLKKLGFTNVYTYGNHRKHWDSYVWSMIKCLREYGDGYFDYIYLDGAHTIFHDLSAFYVAKRLLRAGGILDFDDYNWSWGGSATMNPKNSPWILDFMSDEQIAAPQVKLLIDEFVAKDRDFEVVKATKLFRKKA